MNTRTYLAIAIAAVLDGTTTASFSDDIVNACASRNGSLSVASAGESCKRNEYALSWSVQGPQGGQGPEGPVGPVGPSGPQGEQGPAGPSGPQGGQGLTGLTGETGAQGPMGPPGTQGAVGATGPTGSQGPIGLTGAKGPQGPEGPQGPSGGPIVKDANGQIVGKLIEGGPGTNSDFHYVGVVVNGGYYVLRVSPRGFADSDSDRDMIPGTQYYTSRDCTGDYYFAPSRPSPSFIGSEFQNYSAVERLDVFVHEGKIYQIDREQAFGPVTIGSYFNSSSTTCSMIGIGTWSSPATKVYPEVLPAGAYYEILDLTIFEPPFSLIIE